MGTQAVVENLLGGSAVLGHKIADAVDWTDTIRAGLPAQSAFLLQERLALSAADFAKILAISTRTLSRIRHGKQRMDAVASDRLYRVARLFALACEVLEDEATAVQWLKLPQTGLGGRTPLALLLAEAGAREVENLLLRIEYGVFS
jgi:putative toxin-antitoxin system antitoxin component (TIGR02293 family)